MLFSILKFLKQSRIIRIQARAFVLYFYIPSTELNAFQITTNILEGIDFYKLRLSIRKKGLYRSFLRDLLITGHFKGEERISLRKLKQEKSRSPSR